MATGTLTGTGTLWLRETGGLGEGRTVGRGLGGGEAGVAERGEGGAVGFGVDFWKEPPPERPPELVPQAGAVVILETIEPEAIEPEAIDLCSPSIPSGTPAQAAPAMTPPSSQCRQPPWVVARDREGVQM